MYLYLVSYRWYEDYEPTILVHEKLISKDEWDRIIRSAVLKAVNKLLKTESFIGMPKIKEEVVKILCEDYGFKKPQIIHEYEFWGSVVVDEDDKDDIEELKKYVGEDKVKQILRHNKKIEEQLWKPTR